jgi:ERCC4-type nuclease
MKIKVDTHEPEKIVKYLSDKGHEIILETLPIGDIVCEEKGIIIERKEYSDLVSSIKNMHIQKQLLQMESACEHPILLISGSPDTLHFAKIQWTSEQNTGAIASLLVRYPKLKVAFLPNDKQLCECAIKICEKLNDGKQVTLYDTELMKKNMTVDDHNLRLIMCVPNIGLKLAKTISEKYKPKELYNVTIEQLCEIEGIGKKKAEEIKKIFN